MMSTFADLIAREKVILLDGAMGTELQRRGIDVSLPLWSAAALQKAPETVRAIHQDYLTAGAKILTANTFRTSTFTYLRAGLDQQAAFRTAHEATKRAVALAREVAGNRALVAGSIAPVGDCYTPKDYPGDDVAISCYAELTRWLHEAKVDVLLLETHLTLPELRIALASSTETGLPVLASFLINDSCNLLDGTDLVLAVRSAETMGAQGIMINCVTLEQARKGVRVLADVATLPYGVYANAGRSLPSREGLISEYVTDEEFANATREWTDMGAKVIGGCCGTTPHTIKRIRQELSHLHT